MEPGIDRMGSFGADFLLHVAENRIRKKVGSNMKREIEESTICYVHIH